jgi:hypothetical protein
MENSLIFLESTPSGNFGVNLVAITEHFTEKDLTFLSL